MNDADKELVKKCVDLVADKKQEESMKSRTRRLLTKNDPFVFNAKNIVSKPNQEFSIPINFLELDQITCNSEANYCVVKINPIQQCEKGIGSILIEFNTADAGIVNFEVGPGNGCGHFQS